MKFQVVKAPGLSYETSAQSQIEIPLAHRPDSCLVIGRFPINRLTFPNSNTRPVNNDKSLSRNHLQIVVRDSDLLVRDLGSSSGTGLNGKYHLPPHNWIKVKPGDILHLSETYLRVALDSTAPTTTSNFKGPLYQYVFVEELELVNQSEGIFQLVETAGPKGPVNPPTPIKPTRPVEHQKPVVAAKPVEPPTRIEQTRSVVLARPENPPQPTELRSLQVVAKQPEIDFNKISQLVFENTGQDLSTLELPELFPTSTEPAPSSNEINKLLTGSEIDLIKIRQWLFENPIPDNAEPSPSPAPNIQVVLPKIVQDVPITWVTPVQVEDVAPTVLDVPKPVEGVRRPRRIPIKPEPGSVQEVGEPKQIPIEEVQEPVLDISKPIQEVLDTPEPVEVVPEAVLEIPKTRPKPVWKVPALPKISALVINPLKKKAAQVQEQEHLVLENLVASLIELPPLEAVTGQLLPIEPPSTPGLIFENRIREVLLARQIFWVYLALIGVAELLTAVGIVQIGLPLHALILVMLLLQSAIDPDRSRRQLALALILAPLIRLLSLSLPLLNFNQLIWYPLVAIPLLLTCWLIVQNTGIRWKSLGLSWGNVPVQLMFSLGGVGLGVIEYNILQPRPLFGAISWEILLFGGLNLLFFTGLNEEIIFRGVLQKLAEPVLKDKGLLFLALLFAVLHMGYLSILDLFFVFAVGFVFAYIVRWGGSLLGVVIAHGLTNTTMFLVMPYVAQYPQDPWSQLMPWVLGITTLLSGLGLVRLIWRRTGFKQFLLPRLVQKELKELKN